MCRAATTGLGALQVIDYVRLRNPFTFGSEWIATLLKWTRVIC
jgi:hypothetical protein